MPAPNSVLEFGAFFIRSGKMDFANGLVEITKRLEGYDGNKFVVRFAYYNPEKDEWILKIQESKDEAENESDQ